MKKTLVILLTLVLSAPVVSAQEEKPVQKDYTRGWYVGAQAGSSIEDRWKNFLQEKKKLNMRKKKASISDC